MVSRCHGNSVPLLTSRSRGPAILARPVNLRVWTAQDPLDDGDRCEMLCNRLIISAAAWTASDAGSMGIQTAIMHHAMMMIGPRLRASEVSRLLIAACNVQGLQAEGSLTLICRCTAGKITQLVRLECLIVALVCLQWTRAIERCWIRYCHRGMAGDLIGTDICQ